MQNFLEQAKKSSKIISSLSTDRKNKVLNQMANAIETNYKFIISKNNIDMFEAQQNNLSEALQDRLLLNKERIKAMAEAIRQIAKLKEPC